MEVRKYDALQQNPRQNNSFENAELGSPIKENVSQTQQTGVKRKLLTQKTTEVTATRRKPSNITQKTLVGSSKVLTKNKKKTQDGIENVLNTIQQPIQPDEAEDVISILRSLDPNAKAKEQAAKDVAFIFEPRLYEGETHYARDGNINLYTAENEKKRAALKTNVMVKDAINSITNLYTYERDGTVSKEGYLRVNSCIARILRQDLKETQIAKLVEEDWKHDTRGREGLTRKEIYDSVFELGDIWTPDIDSYQYIAFFDRLSKILRGKEELANKPRTKTSLYN